MKLCNLIFFILHVLVKIYCWYFSITAVVNNVTEIVLTVTYVDSNSTFSAADAVVVTFSPSGVSGPTVLSNDTTDVATSGAGSDPLMTYTVPANTFQIF